MILFLLIVAFYGSKVFLKKYNWDSFSKDQTKSVSGIFVVLVFIRHFFQYVEVQSHDEVLAYLDVVAQQLIVVPFLFFSGYAIMLNLESNREKYLQKLPRKILLLWLHFILGVLLFLTLNCIRGQKYSFSEMILSFLGMVSVGNSTWYIVAIIFMWFFTYISFKVFKKDFISFFVLAVLILAYALSFDYYKGEIWYNTVIAYYLGMLVNKTKHHFDFLICNKKMAYWPLLFASVLVVIFQTGYVLYLFEIRVAFFCLFIVLFCYKVKIDNRALRFLGKYVFEIYLLQRLPMIMFKDVFQWNLLYFVICFMITVLCAILFRKFTDFLDSLVGKGIKNFMN